MIDPGGVGDSVVLVCRPNEAIVGLKGTCIERALSHCTVVHLGDGGGAVARCPFVMILCLNATLPSRDDGMGYHFGIIAVVFATTAFLCLALVRGKSFFSQRNVHPKGTELLL